ncbi:DUF4157 domain-containing protein, partial [uncultured Rhodoblastus sp.]|uniref:eCIS core domain-containing protein n=1 Tax=uncultured Rhodoblastus sp. TaxID=543037 RepID=UPI0025E907F3
MSKLAVQRPERKQAALRRALAEPGRPLPEGVRRTLEGALSADLRSVRIHTGAAADAAARALDAEAVTFGQHILFRAGGWRPETAGGMDLLAHEAAHTLQHRGPAPDVEAAPVSQPGDAIERAAEAAAERGAPPPVLAEAAVARRVAGVAPRAKETADPARTTQEIGRALMARLRADAHDRSGRLRNQLIRMEDTLRRDVLRWLERHIESHEWRALLDLLTEPAPEATEGVEDRQAEAGAPPTTTPEGEQAQATPATGAKEAADKEPGEKQPGEKQQGAQAAKSVEPEAMATPAEPTGEGAAEAPVAAAALEGPAPENAAQTESGGGMAAGPVAGTPAEAGAAPAPPAEAGAAPAEASATPVSGPVAEGSGGDARAGGQAGSEAGSPNQEQAPESGADSAGGEAQAHEAGAGAEAMGSMDGSQPAVSDLAAPEPATGGAPAAEERAREPEAGPATQAGNAEEDGEAHEMDEGGHENEASGPDAAPAPMESIEAPPTAGASPQPAMEASPPESAPPAASAPPQSEATPVERAAPEPREPVAGPAEAPEAASAAMEPQPGAEVQSAGDPTGHVDAAPAPDDADAPAQAEAAAPGAPPPALLGEFAGEPSESDPPAAGGGGGGGGGGGAAAPAPPEPQASGEASGDNPAGALRAMGSMPVGAAARAIDGAGAAVAGQVERQRADLEASPPTLPKPSGAPEGAQRIAPAPAPA